MNVSRRLHLRRKLHWQRLLKLLYIYIKIIYSYIYFTATILNPTFTNSFSEKNSMDHNCTNYSTAAMCSKNEKTKPQIQQQQIWSRENIPQKQRRHLCGESPSAANVSTHTKTTKTKNKQQPMLTAHARALSMIQHVICLSICKQIQPRISFFKFCFCLLFGLNIFYGFPLFLSSFVSLKNDRSHTQSTQPTPTQKQ